MVHTLLYMSIVESSHPAPLSKKLEAEWNIQHSIYDGDIDISSAGTLKNASWKLFKTPTL